MKRVAVLQSNYVPWKGYFDIIHDVDLFVFYDDVQYTKNDWRNRNKIKTPQGPVWLTIPVGNHNDLHICDVTLNDPYWAAKHWKTFHQYYAKAPFFARYADFLQDLYLNRAWPTLSELNQHLIRVIATDFLGVEVEFQDSRDFAPQGGRQERLLDLLQKTGAERYVSGPSARNYIDPAAFEAAGIELVYKDYSGYPEYAQFYPPFAHGVTIFDLLFHTGPQAPDYIWGWRHRG